MFGAKNCPFLLQETAFTAFLSRMSRESQHSRFEDQILGQVSLWGRPASCASLPHTYLDFLLLFPNNWSPLGSFQKAFNKSDRLLIIIEQCTEVQRRKTSVIVIKSIKLLFVFEAKEKYASSIYAGNSVWVFFFMPACPWSVSLSNWSTYVSLFLVLP